MRRAQFDVPGFAAWLAKNGAEVGVPTNAYEVIRYRAYVRGGSKALTHIVYSKENGLLNFQGASREHYTLFSSGMDFARDDALSVAPAPLPATPSKSSAERMRERLYERDGHDCWFCGTPLLADATLEHLVPKSKGGLNGLANYVLAHKACNARAADLPLVKKIEMRAGMRKALGAVHTLGEG